MFAKKKEHSKKRQDKGDGDKQKENLATIRCYKCKLFGHKANVCPTKKKSAKEKSTENVSFYVSSQKRSQSDVKWCLDSGATSHFCIDADYFSEIVPNPEEVKFASNATTVTAGEGKAQFVARAHDKTANVTLNNAIYVPEMRQNLLSVSKITDHGFEILFRKTGALIRDENEKIVLEAERIENLYFIRESGQGAYTAATAPKENKVTLELLHRRLGHANIRDIQEGIQKGILKGVLLSDTTGKLNCNVCLRSKMTRAPFPNKSQRQTNTLDLIHSDVCGPMRTASLGGSKYFVEFIDDSTRWCEIQFLKSKDEVFKAFTNYAARVENEKSITIKCLQSDNGREFLNSEFDDYLKKKGISRRLTVPYNPEQNGIAERKNRTLLEAARCLLKESNLPDYFWAEAVNTANYLRNRLPTKSLNGRTPFEAWTGEAPDVSNLRIFGSKVYYLDRTPGKGKFDDRGQEGIFLGYAEESKAYRVWSSEKRQVLITRDVTFLEDEDHSKSTDFPVEEEAIDGKEDSPQVRQFREVEFSSRHPEPTEEIDHIFDSSDDEDSTGSNDDTETEASSPGSDVFQSPPEPASEENPISQISHKGRGRPKIVRTGLRGRPRKIYNSVPEPSNDFHEEQNQILLSEVPFKEALNSPEADEWRQAIAAEIKSIVKNDTWDLVDRPDNQKVVGSRIVLRNKFHPNGVLEKRKARLVAQGFSQQPGIHFTETFAPVARRSTIRLMASLSASHGMKIRQLDVETAYLNGVLEEEIYMKPPKNLQQILRDIVDSEGENQIGSKAKKMLDKLREGEKVCRLKKSLYGLKQAGRSWYMKLDATMKKLGAVPSKSDPCLFYIGSGEDVVLIATYVDDILIASRNEDEISELIAGLRTNFVVKDLGFVKSCLGMEFEQSNGQVTLHQRGYIEELISRFGMRNCNAVSTPLDPNVKLQKNESQSPEDSRLPYRELVGALTYLASSTRPDISFAASYLGQFNNCFGSEHWRAAKRVLRYLQGTIDLGLTYGLDPGSFKGYADADWGNCAGDRRSYSGYLFMLNGGPISWDSRKQRTVALSTLEAEYMALSESAKEAIFLRRFLSELGFYDFDDLIIFCDNRGSLVLAENDTYHARSKHIDIRHHFVRDVLKKKEFRLQHVPTEDQAADFLTKGLPKSKHKHCVQLAGMKINA